MSAHASPAAPLVLLEERVRPEWLDYNDHMNVVYYAMVLRSRYIAPAAQALRLRVGDPVVLLDGRGRVGRCRIRQTDKKQVLLDLLEDAVTPRPSSLPVMALAFSKAVRRGFFAEKAAELIVDLVRNHIPRRFNLDPVDDIQVLTPMHKGAVGAGRMNACLQEALNPHGIEVRRGDRCFRLHDKVMQIRNNYDKDVFNGDMGRISFMDVRERTLSITFDERVVPYEFDELDEIAPAYAISIHKSQGSEYPAVVIPVMMQHYVLLQRNLIYTGVTRGKKLVILVGESRALHMAVKNNKTRKRFTRLAQRLTPVE